MKARRAELVAHVGGAPNAVQRQLIERAVRLSLQLELMDERLTHGEVFKTRDHNHYLAWSNALVRTLAQLGIKGIEAKAPSLADYLAAKARQPAARAEVETAA